MQIADKKQVTARVAARLELADDQAVELVERAEEIFRTETGRLQLPERAFWLWVDLAIAIYRENTAAGARQIASIKRGDTSIQYDNAATSTPLTGSLLNRVRLWRVARAR